MNFFEGYRCTFCEREVPAGSRAGECPVCSGPLVSVYDLALLGRQMTAADFFAPGSGVWRFAPLLPVLGAKVTLGEGSTPLLPVSRLGARVGVPSLFIKDESANPTGSFKARGMAVAVSRLVGLGVGEAWIPSAGNAGLALAAYGAAAGLDTHVFIPAETPAGVAEECRLYGAAVEPVPGSLADAAARAERAVGEDRAGYIATFREPGRVEGKKTIAFELAASLPVDWIIYPTGGGTGVVAFWKAFHELDSLGWLEGPIPRIAVVQAAGCAPIVRAFAEGAERAERWENPKTAASGIRVPSSRADRIMLRILREDGGTAIAVPDEEIMAAVREIASDEGVFPSPEGAACWAGLKRLVEAGTVSPSSRVVMINTAGGARYRFLLDR